ncbi:MAG: hypothetical protein JWQ40_3756 [Segetibacter sp.]|nr:hypothetical protein [Segetibacter sp.]
MKKKLTLLLVIFININYFCFAQGQDGNKKAESVQIAYITKELALTPGESEKLWPIYNNYKNEIRSAIKANGSQIEMEEKVLNTKKKYKNDFQKVLGSEERVNKLFEAEKNFREILRQELERRNRRE